MARSKLTQTQLDEQRELAFSMSPILKNYPTKKKVQKKNPQESPPLNQEVPKKETP